MSLPLDVSNSLVRDGRTAYRLGHPRAACPPFIDPLMEKAWSSGWDGAYQDDVLLEMKRLDRTLWEPCYAEPLQNFAAWMVRRRNPGRFA